MIVTCSTVVLGPTAAGMRPRSELTPEVGRFVCCRTASASEELSAIQQILES